MHIKENTDDRLAFVRTHASLIYSILSERDEHHFEIDELYQLGIHAVKVELDEEEGILGFEPCFYLPQPQFSKTRLELWIVGFSISLHAPGDRDREEERSFEDEGSERQADIVQDYVDRQIEAERDGIDSERQTLASVAPINFRYSWESHLSAIRWQMVANMGSSTSSHCIVTMIHASKAEDTWLSTGEVLCILRMLEDSFELKYPSEDTEPYLLMSYFAEKK
ncbi:hypothetical protein PVAR5_6542 [Paecilomyces variotii No. 5]|uniref:Uncharacterized protein n=1 Tax=Byssochlamys spectabilis (strain No. 5 / NBRC 109023) TaxID=1356009 RepID=V5FJ83_BYSSN|nr:hypothetical protein PVAR5_6542 [Paecilomyces variotii No. 5]